MKCPHCTVSIHPSFTNEMLNRFDRIGKSVWQCGHMTCPNCNEAIITLEGSVTKNTSRFVRRYIAFPRSASARQPAPVEVPAHIAEDYMEASAILSISPKASAALSRRCLQSVLRENGYGQKDLAPAIQAAIDSKSLPSALAENIDAIRNIGNFAAHPLKDTNSGQILPVEPHEAEWNLDVLEDLFDFYYVQPARAKERRQALNEKLAQVGKPPMK